MRSLAERGISIKFQYLPDHRGIVGNEEVNTLEIKGSKMTLVSLNNNDFEDRELDNMIAEMEDIY